MSLNKANISWSSKQIASMVKKGTIVFDSIVQRSLVWKKPQKSSLIESILIGYPIPTIFAKKSATDDSKIYSVLDGKQRLTTIKEFFNDEFELTGLAKFSYEDDENNNQEIELNGLKFSTLPEILQDKIKDSIWNICYFDNLTDNEEREMFRRLNAGTALSSKSKMLASCNDIPSLLEIGNHKLFNEMLSEKQRDSKNQAIIIMKINALLNMEIKDITFNGDKFTDVIKNTHLTEEDVNKLTILFDTIVGVHDLIAEEDAAVASKLYTETHLLSFVRFIAKAIDDSCTDADIARAIIQFFNNVPEDYVYATTNAVASNRSIRLRDCAIENFFSTTEEVEDEAFTA